MACGGGFPSFGRLLNLIHLTNLRVAASVVDLEFVRHHQEVSVNVVRRQK